MLSWQAKAMNQSSMGIPRLMYSLAMNVKNRFTASIPKVKQGIKLYQERDN